MISFRSCRDLLAEALDAAVFLAVGLRSRSYETGGPVSTPQPLPKPLGDVPGRTGHPQAPHDDTGRI